MKRKTNAKPLLFSVDGYSLRSYKLGFLAANEFLFKYLPIISGLTDKFKDLSDENGELDIGSAFKDIPQGLIDNVCKELLFKTEVLDEDTGNFETLDPDNFESLQQCFSVIWQIFQFNFPDFFENGADIQDLLTVPETKTEVKEIPQDEKDQDRIFL